MQVNAHVAGVLLNAVDLSSPDYYYYYEYQGKYAGYYHDHSSHDDDDGDGDIEDTVDARSRTNHPSAAQQEVEALVHRRVSRASRHG